MIRCMSSSLKDKQNGFSLLDMGLWDDGGVKSKIKRLEVCLQKPWVRAKATEPFIVF